MKIAFIRRANAFFRRKSRFSPEIFANNSEILAINPEILAPAIGPGTNSRQPDSDDSFTAALLRRSSTIAAA
jgi:hypothetical protein